MSISSTFFARIFRTKAHFWHQNFVQSWLLDLKFWRQKFRTKNVCVKHWWDWLQKGNEAWQKLMNEKDVEVEKLKKQLAEAEKQLRIQTQVRISNLENYSWIWDRNSSILKSWTCWTMKFKICFIHMSFSKFKYYNDLVLAAIVL